MTIDETYVRLKYQIVTSDKSTWGFCQTYPQIVRVKWALRCAKEVMHLVADFPEIIRCIETTQKWIDGLASDEEVITVGQAGNLRCAGQVGRSGIAAANSAVHTIATAASSKMPAFAYDHAIYAALFASRAGGKWDTYIKWLIEELGNYEELK